MGTSGSFGGSKIALVPSWVDEPPSIPVAAPSAIPQAPGDGNEGDVDNNGNDQGQLPPPVAYPPLRTPHIGSTLRSARGSITRGARSSDSKAIRRGAGQYVKASGGGRGATRRMSSSKATASRVANLVHAFASQGPEEALKSYNLEGLAGAPAEDVFVALTDVLCPPGGAIDEAIARNAMLETIAAFAAEGIGNFDELTVGDLQEFFIGVVCRSIEGKILNEVGTNSISVPSDLAGVERAQRMLHDFVDRCVRDEFADTGSNIAEINSEQIDGFVSDLYVEVFELMQALGETS